MALIQPLKPYTPFTDREGRLTKDGYAFLFNMYLRVGGSLSSLNAVTLADATWDAPDPIGTTTPNIGKFTTLSASGQLTSTVTTGTAPLIIASTTNVANLNASSLSGATFAAPGTIGGGTPGTATFVGLTATGAVALSPANLNVVLSPTGTGLVTINPATLGTIDKMTIGGSTPAAGTFTTINGNTFTAGTGVLTIAAGKTLTASRTLTFTGTDSTTMTFPATSATIARIDAGNTFTGNQLVTGSVTAFSGTAIPSGGTAATGLMVSSTANFGVFFGSGVPTLSAAKGSLYLRSDGTSTSTRMYVNTDGSTTWTNVTTAA